MLACDAVLDGVEVGSNADKSAVDGRGDGRFWVTSPGGGRNGAGSDKALTACKEAVRSRRSARAGVDGRVGEIAAFEDCTLLGFAEGRQASGADPIRRRWR